MRPGWRICAAGWRVGSARGAAQLLGLSASTFKSRVNRASPQAGPDSTSQPT